MRRLFVFLFALLVLSACGSKREKAISEAKKIMQEMTATVNKASKAINEAKDGKEAAVAIETMAADLKKLKAQADELDKKYPDLKIRDDKSQPELEAEMKAFTEAIGQLMKSFEGDAKKLSSPEFLAAVQKLEGLQ